MYHDYYDLYYALEELLSSGLSGLGAQTLFSGLFSIAAYVLTGMGLYAIAQRRGLKRPWLAWIPVLRIWLIGSVSDQYQYVVHGRTRAKRKALLTMSIVLLALETVLSVVVVSAGVQLIVGYLSNYIADYLIDRLLGRLFGVLGLALAILGLRIARKVVRYIAMYDVYRSLDPGNCVMFLVLSILFPVTEPFFLFCNRNKELGMPPRRTDSPEVME